MTMNAKRALLGLSHGSSAVEFLVSRNTGIALGDTVIDPTRSLTDAGDTIFVEEIVANLVGMYGCFRFLAASGGGTE